MSSSTDLLVLRLGLIAIVLIFGLVVAYTMRKGLQAQVAVSRRAPRLIVIAPGESGLEPGAAFAVAGVMSIGRDPDNSIVLPDPSVSGEHAMFERLREGWRLTDLGSTNGTMVNGRRIDGRGVAVRGGERIAVGAVVLRFES